MTNKLYNIIININDEEIIYTINLAQVNAIVYNVTLESITFALINGSNYQFFNIDTKKYLEIFEQYNNLMQDK